MAAVSEGQTAPELHVRERLALAYPPVHVAWGLSIQVGRRMEIHPRGQRCNTWAKRVK